VGLPRRWLRQLGRGRGRRTPVAAGGFPSALCLSASAGANWLYRSASIVQLAEPAARLVHGVARVPDHVQPAVVPEVHDTNSTAARALSPA